MKERLKRNYKLIVGIVIGFVIASSSVYVLASDPYSSTGTSYSSSNISYNNQNSKLAATDLQAAIDELNEKADIRKSGNIVSAYEYNASTCVTGEESTCVKTTCYPGKSCSPGTIIKYKVNDTDIVTFHVMWAFTTSPTTYFFLMQTQKNTISNTKWNSSGSNTQGPLTVLEALENATSDWTNIPDVTYTTPSNAVVSNTYTGCSSATSCTSNKYTLGSRTAKARMITAQEASMLGCGSNTKSCPKWMYNYLSNSKSYGGTVNGNSKSKGYWTMNAYSANDTMALLVSGYGSLGTYEHASSGNANSAVSSVNFGARAVVDLSKY